MSLTWGNMKAILFFVTVSFLLSGCDAIQDLSSEASEWLAESRKQREAIAQQREQNSQKLVDVEAQLKRNISEEEKSRLRIEQERLRLDQERLQREENQRRQEEQQREVQRRAEADMKIKLCSDTQKKCISVCHASFCEFDHSVGTMCNKRKRMACKVDCQNEYSQCRALINRY